MNHPNKLKMFMKQNPDTHVEVTYDADDMVFKCSIIEKEHFESVGEGESLDWLEAASMAIQAYKLAKG